MGKKIPISFFRSKPTGNRDMRIVHDEVQCEERATECHQTPSMRTLHLGSEVR